MLALEELIVLDLSESVAGQYCSRLMAGFGANVTLVEPVGGSSLRKAHPVSKEWGDSILFFHLNLDKTALELDWESPDGFAQLRTMAAGAQVVLIPQGMQTDRLRAAAPGTVFCEIGAFDERGPYAGWRGGEMVFQALAGTMYRNGEVGREPLFGVGHRVSCMTGVAAYSAILSALRRGGGELVRMSVHTTAAACSYQIANQYLQNGTFDVRGGPLQVAELVVPCEGGWVVIFIHDRRWRDFCDYFGLDALRDDARFADSHVNRIQHLDEIIAATSEVSATRDAVAVMNEMQALGIPTMLAFQPSDLDASEHLRLREFWRSVAMDGGRRRVTGPICRMANGDWRTEAPCRPANGAGQAGVPASPSPEKEGAPLAGIKVLDLTTAWAGPMAARVLAALGAEVIHVESVARMDLARANPLGDHPARYVGKELGDKPYNRSIFFNAQNLHKKSLSIDIKKEGGGAALKAVAEHVDVVLGNFSPGALARMGLVYEELKESNPGLVYLEMPACGTWGPMASFTGLGPNMEFAAGMAAFVGYGDGRPYPTGPAYMDPIGGFNGAAAILTALLQRATTGKGQYVELSQVEGGIPHIGELVLDCLERGEDPRPQGNDLPDKRLHDTFRCKGHEAWIAIVCDDDADLERLADAMARDGATLDPAALKRTVGEWTADQDKQALAARLQDAGVAAAPVNHGKDVALDPHLDAIGFFDEIDHPEVGLQRYQGLPFRFADAPLPQLTHAPLLGQDTAEILARLAGFSAEKIAALHEAGTISFASDDPLAAYRAKRA
jgi:crotonobetainyl-CoA:carnitine CoA-transferase CaiB-like acyl-CoA transferase